MDDEEKIEYRELSEDWRHRDSLTWRIFAVIIAVVGVYIPVGFKLLVDVDPVIVRAIFIFATAFAFCLTFALGQNLSIQKKTRDTLICLYRKTERFDSPRIGSFILLGLSVLLTGFLFLLLFL